MARKRIPIQHPPVVFRFAARIRELRRERGLTQQELADRAGLTSTYLSRLESAGAAPGIDLVDRLATALGTSIHDILPLADPPDMRVGLRQEAERLLGSLDEDQESLRTLVQVLAVLVRNRSSDQG
jgi:transcriptional regulator with XRE-family HTH domain